MDQNLEVRLFFFVKPDSFLNQFMRTFLYEHNSNGFAKIASNPVTFALSLTVNASI